MRSAGVLLLILGLAPSAHAVDGVLEINQACATGPGCFAGDGAGYPVEINVSGSYRLTSDLTSPDQSTRVIWVNNDVVGPQIAEVTLDLNGFAIRGPNSWSLPGPCTAPATSHVGIFTQAAPLVVMNGTVRGMGSHGIFINNSGSRVERVVAEENCGVGILTAVGALVIDSIARGNSGNGMEIFGNSRISNSAALGNGGHGIAGTGGGLLIQGCNANENIGDGISSAGEDFVLDSVANGNVGDGIRVGDNSIVLRSSASGNRRGILATPTSGVGFVTAAGNSVVAIDGGPQLVACVMTDAAQVCP